MNQIAFYPKQSAIWFYSLLLFHRYLTVIYSLSAENRINDTIYHSHTQYARKLMPKANLKFGFKF